MFRTVSVILAVGAVVLLVPTVPAAPPAGLKLGEDFKGKIGGTTEAGMVFLGGLKNGHYGEAGFSYGPRGPNDPFRVSWRGYKGEVPVTLKEGQSLAISVTVTGDKRKVFLKLLDPAGKQVANSEDVAEKSAKLAVEEVNASGKYTIVVVSDQVGGFTLRAKGGAEEDDEEKLKEQIKQREEELAELKAKLKALQAKRPGLRTKDPE